MANLEGMVNKFLVMKVDDIEKLTFEEKMALGHVAESIQNIREEAGKPKDNTYLVINTDEPYADEVIAILKRHGHWG